MEGFLHQAAALMLSLAALWFVLIGGCFVLQRRDCAARVATWPFRISFRAARWAIGTAFILLRNALRELGQFIRG